MSKWMLWSAAVLFTFGCRPEEEIVEPPEEEVEEVENEEEEIEIEEVENTEETETIDFVLQVSDEMAGVSPENDDALSWVADIINEANPEDIGEEGEIRAQYTGVYLSTSNEIRGIFLLSNRTDEAMTNIGIDLTVETETNVLFENTPIFLAEEHFGVLEPHTMMPIYVEIDTAQNDVFEQINQTRGEITYIDILMSDSPGDNPEAIEPEGYGHGYRPEYVDMLLAEQGGQTEPTGEVPDLEFVLPNELQDADDLDFTLLHVEQVVDLAAAEAADNDISIFWTGVAEQVPEEGGFVGIFLLSNRTGTNFENIEFGFTFEDELGNVVFENQLIRLDAEEFGVFRSDTIMPVYIDIPEEGENTFLGIIEQYHAMYRFESWEADEVN